MTTNLTDATKGFANPNCAVCNEPLDESMGSYGACWVEGACLAHCTDFIGHCTDLPKYEADDEAVARVLEQAREERADRKLERSEQIDLFDES